MPVPVWDSSELSSLDEPLETVPSDDIWKKFDLDIPLEMYTHHHHERTYEDNSVLPELYGKVTCYESREIRHHDCMWAGLCISKEHNRTLPAKKDSQVHRKVPAGRSLLISRATPSSQQSHPQNHYQQQHQHQHQHQQQHRRTDSLESDGDSTRPETPQSSSESDSDSEAEIPIFKHDQISINEKLSECMTMVTKAAPVSEVTGQLVRKCQERRKVEAMVAAAATAAAANATTAAAAAVAVVAAASTSNCTSIDSLNATIENRNTNINSMENEIRNTLSDHCYHINQPNNKKLDHLGVQTPSDSEEEIDVVNLEKPTRPAVLPTHPSPADQQVFQLTVNTAFKDKPAPRPRGRPPSNGNRKRTSVVQQHEQPKQQPAKRPKQRVYQRKTKIPKSGPPTPMSSPIKSSSASSSRSSSDDEPDTEKRNLHNNMERQRRIELRNAFEDLRRLVPEIEAKEKAPKVAILRQAAKYCDRLKDINQDSLTRISDMKKRQEKLRARLSFLRRSLAMTR